MIHALSNFFDNLLLYHRNFISLSIHLQTTIVDVNGRNIPNIMRYAIPAFWVVMTKFCYFEPKFVKTNQYIPMLYSPKLGCLKNRIYGIFISPIFGTIDHAGIYSLQNLIFDLIL